MVVSKHHHRGDDEVHSVWQLRLYPNGNASNTSSVICNLCKLPMDYDGMSSSMGDYSSSSTAPSSSIDGAVNGNNPIPSSNSPQPPPTTTADECKASFTIRIMHPIEHVIISTKYSPVNLFSSYSNIIATTGTSNEHGGIYMFPISTMKDNQTISYLADDVLLVQVEINIYGSMQYNNEIQYKQSSKKRSITSIIKNPHSSTDPSYSGLGSKKYRSSSSSTISDDIIALFNDEDTADVTIITANNERIRTHKLILSIRSVVFKKMLHHSMTESNTNEIHIIDFDEAIIRLFLRFLYQDHLSEDTLIKHNTELYTMACKYQVEGLERLCEYSMCRCMSSGNVMDLLQLSDLHNSLPLRKHALMFLKKNSSEVVQQPKFFPKLLSLLDHSSSSSSGSSSSSRRRDCGEEVGHDAVEMVEDKHSINHHDHDRAGGKCCCITLHLSTFVFKFLSIYLSIYIYICIYQPIIYLSIFFNYLCSNN